MPAPAALLDEADRAAADELRDRVGDILALGPRVEWTYTWARGIESAGQGDPGNKARMFPEGLVAAIEG